MSNILLLSQYIEINWFFIGILKLKINDKIKFSKNIQKKARFIKKKIIIINPLANYITIFTVYLCFSSYAVELLINSTIFLFRVSSIICSNSNRLKVPQEFSTEFLLFQNVFTEIK